MKQIKKVPRRIVALLICVMMLLSMLPISIFTVLASTTTSLTTNVDSQTYYVGQEKEFTYTTNVSADDNGKMVVGAFKLLNGEDVDVISTAIEKLWYWDTTGNQWLEFPDGYFKFGPSTGFPFTDGFTSKFKVKFAQLGDYKVVAEMLEVNNENAVLTSTENNISVKSTASELQSDITTKTFEVNSATEFSYTTVPNDLLNTMVLGTFTLKDSSDNDAQDFVKLEYWNVNTNTWDEFYGDFGPSATGFPLVEATSKFRATFNKIGTYTVNAAMKKFDGGEILSTNNATIEVKDTTAPVVSEVTGNPTDWTKDDVTLTVVATDNSGSVSQYRVNNGAWQSSAQFSVNENGSYEFEAKDTSGNIGNINITVDKIDKTAPSAAVQLDPDALRPDGSWTKDEITVTVNATDNESGVKEYIVDGNSQATNTFTITDDSEHTVKIIDNAGNQSDVVKFSAKYDATAPTINSITGNPTEWTNGDVTLTISAVDTGCNGIQYSIDNVTWKFENAFVVTENNDYTIYVKDMLGNTTSQVVSVTKIDKADPTISDFNITTENWTNQDVTISGKFADNSNDSISAYYKVGEDSWKTLSLDDENKFSINVSDECNTTYTFKSVDKAGNDLITASKAVKIDKTNSTLTVNAVPNEWKNDQINVTGTISDAASGIKTAKYSISSTNGVTDFGDVIITGSDYAFTTAVSESGIYTYTITATDNAGNIIDVTTDEIKIDLTKPNVDSVVPSITGWTNQTVMITVGVSDTYSGISKVFYKRGEAVTEIVKTDGIYSFVIPNTVNDNEEYEIYCVDVAGNTSVVSSYTSKVDVTAPSVPVIKYNKTIIDKFIETITFGLYQSDVEVTISVTDDLSGLKEIVYFKGTEEISATPVDGKVVFTIEPNFKGKITAVAYDNAGNNSSEQTVGTDTDNNEINGVIVDDVIPVVDTAVADKTVWTNTAVKITGTVSDNLSKVEKVFWRQGESETETPAILNNNGTYEFIVPAQDYEGTVSVLCYDYTTNKSVDKVANLKMDVTQPTVETAVADITDWTNGNIKVTGTVSDNLAGVEKVYWRQGDDTTENAAILNTDGTFEFVVSTQDYEGSIYVGCYDYSTNKATEKSVEINMDVTNPTIDSAIPNKTDWTNGDIVVTGTVSDNLSEVKNVYWRQGDNTTENIATLNSDGTYQFTIPAQNYIGHIYVGCYDYATNKATESFVAVKMDVVKPVVDTGVADITVWTNNSITVSGSVSDTTVNDACSEVVAVEYVYDNNVKKTATLVNGSYEFTIPDTNYNGNVTIWCLDNAGNQSDNHIISVKMDIQKPAVNSGVAVSNDWTNEKVVISGTVSDTEVNNAISGVKTVKYLDTTNNEQIANTFISSTGAYTIEISKTDYKGDIVVWCEDNAGNKSDNFHVGVKMDITAPSVPVIEVKTPKVIDVILKSITFGFYKSDVTVVITSDDNFDSDYNTLKNIEYEYVGTKSKYDTTVISDSDIVTVNSDNSISFNLPSEFVGTIKARAFDLAGNISNWKTTVDATNQANTPVSLDKVVVDKVNPYVNVEFSGSIKDKIDVDIDGQKPTRQTKNTTDSNTRFVYDGNVTATITVTEANFYEEDVSVIVNKDGVVASASDYTESEWVKNPITYVFTKTIVMKSDGDYQIFIEYKDKSDNAMDFKSIEYEDNTGTLNYESNIHTIDTTIPAYAFEIYDNEDVVQTIGTRDYLDAVKTGIIKVTDRNFRPNEVDITVLAKDVKDESVTSYTYSNLKSWNDWTAVDGEDYTWTASVPFTTDANYTVEFTYLDIAGHKVANEFHKEFTVDTNIPENLNVEYERANLIDNILETLTFGFYKPDVKVTISATDATAGIEYFTVDVEKQGLNEATNIDTPENLVLNADGTVKSGTAGFINNATATEDDGKVELSFMVPAQFRGEIIIDSVTDLSHNTSGAYDDNNEIIVDTVSPEVTIEFEGSLKDKVDVDVVGQKPTRQTKTVADASTRYVYDGEITATITVKEANFYEDMVVTVYRDGAVVTDSEISAWVQTGDTYEFVKTIKLSKDGDYQIKLSYEDKTDNGMEYTGEYGQTGTTNYTSNIHTIDTTIPTYNITYDNDTVIQTIDGRDYFDANRTATINVTDRNFRPNEVVFSVEAKDVTDTKNIDKFTYSNLKSWDSWTQDGITWTATVPFTTDANYTVEFAYEDIADHKMINAETNAEEIYSKKFTVDKVNPKNLTITYLEPTFIEKVIENVTFHFYNAPVKVEISATDDISGVYHFMYSYAKSVGVSDVNAELINEAIANANIAYSGNKATATFTIPKKALTDNNQFRGNVVFTAYDRSENNDDTKDTTVVVVDSIAPQIDVFYTANDTETEIRYVDDNVKDVDDFNSATQVFYNGDVTAKIRIDEANFFEGKNYASGIVHEVGILLTKTDNNGVVTKTEYMPSGSTQMFASETSNKKNIEWTHSGDIHTFEIDYDKNADYVLTVKYVDLSTNESEINANDGKSVVELYNSKTVTVDKINPVINVEYSNNDVKNTIDGRKYFDKQQVATITVTEHNFRADDVDVDVIAKNVIDEDVSVADFNAQLRDRANWTHYDEKGNIVDKVTEGNVHVATITYSVDANYTFDIAYTDLAKRDAKDYDANLFTVDKTAPTNLTVTYSEPKLWDKILESITFGFYNAQMEVAITADDITSGIYHFKYSYIKSEGVSDVNAELIDQAISNANITYTEKTATAKFKIPKLVLKDDNQFNGTVEFTAYDRAENNTDMVDEERIVVDNIKPNAKITYNEPVQNANNISYYAGDINATIVINEANFYSQDVNVTVTKDGTNYPVTVQWKDDSVDVHTGTFTLTEDGDYIVTVKYADRSTNEMDTYESNRLTIDTKAPTVSVSSIKNNSANKDEKYGFTITANDINIDMNSIKPVLTAVVRDENGNYSTKPISLGNIKTVEDGKTYSFTVENLEDDAVYTLVCTLKDMSGNEYSKIGLSDGKEYEEVRFSINRDGSTFAVNESTDKLLEQYYVYSVNEDVVIEEINVDPIENYTVKLNGEVLGEGKDYTTTITNNNGEWSKRTYVIKKSLFEKEGEYSIIVESIDKAETTAFSDVKNLKVAFVVDQTAPVLTISGLEEGGRYQIDEQTVTVIPTDDGGKLNSFKAILLDSDGKEIEVRFEISGDELIKSLEENDGKITFTVPEGLENQIRIICDDCAVNAEGKTNAYDNTFTKVTVSPSGWVIYYANKPLFYGSIGGIIALAGGILLFVFFRKRKKLVP